MLGSFISTRFCSALLLAKLLLQLACPGTRFLGPGAERRPLLWRGALELRADRVALGAQPVDLGLQRRTSPSSASKASRSSDTPLSRIARSTRRGSPDEVQSQHGRAMRELTGEGKESVRAERARSA
jgi:hypothetical protein